MVEINDFDGVWQKCPGFFYQPEVFFTLHAWKKVGSSGWVYKDQTGGVTKLLLLGGAAGTPSVQLRSKGTGLPLPAPLNGSTYFDQDTEVILQLHRSNPVDCWSSSFVAVNTSKNDGSQFKAKSP